MKGYTCGLTVALATTTALALAGCAPTDAADDATPTIVASTNVYGDIADAIAGDRATVVSIITGSAIDPHSYEASARDQLELSRADIIIENGGGFDPFVRTLLDALDTDPVVITATELATLPAGVHDDHDHDQGPDDSSALDSHDDDHDHAHDHGDEAHDHGNEHVWYSLITVDALATELTQQLVALDPDGADEYERNHAEFVTELDRVAKVADDIRMQHAGTGVAITEPAPQLLLETLGLVNETPAEFSAAIEAGTDVAPSLLLRMRDIITNGSVSLLAYNAQTSGPETEQLRQLAVASGVSVVEIMETLPEGETYLTWMEATISEIAAALDAA